LKKKKENDPPHPSKYLIASTGITSLCSRWKRGKIIKGLKELKRETQSCHIYLICIFGSPELP